MSMIQLQNFNPPAQNTLIAVLGDTIDLLPNDQRFSYSYAAPTKPGGSTAAFTGSRFTPDVVGAYSLSVSAGTDTLTVPCFVFTTAVLNSLAKRADGTIRLDDEKRRILNAFAQRTPTATLVAMNSGTWPAGVDSYLSAYGG